MMRKMNLGAISIAASEEWFDVADDLDQTNAPYSLAKVKGGVGTLQFSVALYESGRTPAFKISDLDQMLEEFARNRGLGIGFDKVESAGDPLVVASSFRSESDLVRVWYVSDGESVALVTYVCAWDSRGLEISECEQIVLSTRFTTQER